MRTTGVGSLPHTDPAAAAAFVMATADIPYLAQLPRRHPEEMMLPQWGDGLCGCGSVEGGLGLSYGIPPGPREEAFVGAAAVLELAAPAADMVKTQATGPITLGLGFAAAGHPGDVWDCVTDGLVVRIQEHLDAIQARLPGAEVILILDEPALTGLPDRAFPLARDEIEGILGRVLGGLGCRAGIHCCGETDWTLIAGLGPAFVSWDVRMLGLRFLDDAPALAKAIEGGTRVIWGAAPTTALPLSTSSELTMQVEAAMGALTIAGATYSQLRAESLLSPACGLAGLSVDQAESVAGLVTAVGRELVGRRV